MLFFGGTNAICHNVNIAYNKHMDGLQSFYCCFILFVVFVVFFFTEQHYLLRAVVVALSCVVFLQLVVVAFLIWRQKRSMPGKTNTPDNCTTSEVERHGSPCDYHISEPGVYMELHIRPSEGQSREPPEYRALQGKNTTPGYYNAGFNRRNKAQVEEVYENIEIAQA